jgi:O-antigen ligase
VLGSATVRVATVAPVTALALLGWFLHLAIKGRTLRLDRLPLRSLALVLASFAAATLLAQKRGTAVQETFNFGLLVAFMVMAVDTLTGKPDKVEKLLKLLALVAAVCGGLAMLEAVGLIPNAFPRYGTRYQRAALGFGQPNALGLFFALTLPFAVCALSMARNRFEVWLLRGGLALIVLGLAATFSRGSWLSVLFGSLLLIPARQGRFTLRVWATALLAALFIEVVSGGMLTDTAQRTVSDWVLEQRAALMYTGVLMFLQYPWFGVGPGNYANMLERFGAQVPQLWDYLPTPHNAFIQMGAETGAIGLAAFVLLLTVVSVTAVRKARIPAQTHQTASLRRAVVWSMGTLVCACLVVWPFSHGTGQCVMIALGLQAVAANAGDT